MAKKTPTSTSVPTGPRARGAMTRAGIEVGLVGNDRRGHIAVPVLREADVDRAVDVLAAAFPTRDVVASVFVPHTGLNRSVTVLVSIAANDDDQPRRVEKAGPAPLPDAAFARAVTAAWRATGPVGNRDRGVIRASEGAQAYAAAIAEQPREVAARHAALFGYDELVDLERALARLGRHTEALDAVESRRQLLDRDDPHAWNHHLGQACPACPATDEV